MASIELTMDELKTLIAEIVEEKLEEKIHETASSRVRRLPRRKRDTRSPEEVQASIERNRWTPPPGAKSSLELLREDRDR